ncbi:LpxI family protein [Verrucomicrobium sp. 3C]|uniref:LpxI family protein n=1 Tax=Verrucomicrobium sp. 3C TaxID=1134055 RepID=UPI000375478B|nr:UDP-2,3-diacylglucosamine diphosphatase LpxI [Verrucomicrobium sp. 3C]
MDGQESIREDGLGLIAGRGIYPVLLARAARRAGVERVSTVAFVGETDPEVEKLSSQTEWLRVGQLASMLRFFRRSGVSRAVMAGAVAPSHLFNLRPDLKALLLLASLKVRNAATIFGAIAKELRASGVVLMPATTYLEEELAPAGHFGGPPLRPRQKEDAGFGFRMAKEIARLDIGQSLVVKQGTVLAVEAFEGTDQTLERGGGLGRGKAVLIKVSKPDQDFRFDVPAIGWQTIEMARKSGVALIVCEAGRTLILEKERVVRLAEEVGISLYGMREDGGTS